MVEANQETLDAFSGVFARKRESGRRWDGRSGRKTLLKLEVTVISYFYKAIDCIERLEHPGLSRKCRYNGSSL